jgi:hypothetical protein
LKSTAAIRANAYFGREWFQILFSEWVTSGKRYRSLLISAKAKSLSRSSHSTRRLGGGLFAVLDRPAAGLLLVVHFQSEAQSVVANLYETKGC